MKIRGVVFPGRRSGKCGIIFNRAAVLQSGGESGLEGT